MGYFGTLLSPLTHVRMWCEVIIGLGNGLASVRCQATTRINAALLPMGPREKVQIHLRRKQNCRHFSDDIFKRIFLNENGQISTNNYLHSIPHGLVNYNKALVQIMAWFRPGDEPLSEPIMVRCVLMALKFKNDIFGKACIRSAWASGMELLAKGK